MGPSCDETTLLGQDHVYSASQESLHPLQFLHPQAGGDIFQLEEQIPDGKVAACSKSPLASMLMGQADNGDIACYRFFDSKGSFTGTIGAGIINYDYFMGLIVLGQEMVQLKEKGANYRLIIAGVSDN